MRGMLRARSARVMHEQAHGPNMTPMVDIVMVILIFFMASAAIMGPEWLLRTALPSPKAVGSAAAGDVTPVSASVQVVGGSFRVVLRVGEARREAGVESVASEAASLAREFGADRLVVAIDADAEAPYDAVVRVHEAFVKAGVTRIGLPAPR